MALANLNSAFTSAVEDAILGQGEFDIQGVASEFESPKMDFGLKLTA